MAENMVSGDKIVVDADELLKRIDKVRGSLDELSSFLARGMTAKPSDPAIRRPVETVSKSAMPETGVWIPTDGWTSYKSKGPAGPEEPGWRFASDRENEVHPEVEELVNRIWEQNRVEQGGFVYTLSKDSKFLQRNRAGKRVRVNA